MRSSIIVLAGCLFLAACGGTEEVPQEETGPAALELTPGAWAANATQVSYADEAGTLLATFRCDAETAELIFESPGEFAEGARNAMLIRVGTVMHGLDPVEVRGEGEDAVKTARLPNSGGIVDNFMEANVPMTIETDGGEPIMIETDENLQGFVARCIEQTPTTTPESIEGEPVIE